MLRHVAHMALQHAFFVRKCILMGIHPLIGLATFFVVPELPLDGPDADPRVAGNKQGCEAACVP